ncbi:hypothetical protein ES703_65513 [subsurface metagenome]
MSLEVWIPEGIEREHSVTVSGETKTLSAFPYKWFTAECFNEGPDEVKISTNDCPPQLATTLNDRESKTFGTEKKPTIWQIIVKAEEGKTATVKINTER